MNIFWFRRDLRLADNAGLYHALKSGAPVLPIFIFDTNILDDLQDRDDARVTFIYNAITDLNKQLEEVGSSLCVFHGAPTDVFKQLVAEYAITTVFANNDYESYAIERDDEIASVLRNANIKFLSYKDHVIFEKDEIVKDDRSPYVVYTPYSRKWKSAVNDFYLKPYPTHRYYKGFLKGKPGKVPSLEEMGFSRSNIEIPATDEVLSIIKNYQRLRDFPAENGTSRLGIHLRFGTISIRELARDVKDVNEKYLNELIWRDFYQMILFKFPHIGKGKSFKPEYDRIEWRNNEQEFAFWCEGKTGYPLVDAGMRQLTATGFMHNRVRMVTASFLCKHLLIDWRWGEAHFARLLLDYDFASNNGGWQWAAGSGCDAAPYFRIFNPTTQAKKFDPDLKYIRKWIPELDSFEYPRPIVEHDFARKRCIDAYSKAVKKLV